MSKDYGTEAGSIGIGGEMAGRVGSSGPSERVVRNQIAFIKGVTGTCGCPSCCQARDVAEAASNPGSEY